MVVLTDALSSTKLLHLQQGKSHLYSVHAVNLKVFAGILKQYNVAI